MSIKNPCSVKLKPLQFVFLFVSVFFLGALPLKASFTQCELLLRDGSKQSGFAKVIFSDQTEVIRFKLHEEERNRKAVSYNYTTAKGIILIDQDTQESITFLYKIVKGNTGKPRLFELVTGSAKSLYKLPKSSLTGVLIGGALGGAIGAMAMSAASADRYYWLIGDGESNFIAETKFKFRKEKKYRKMVGSLFNNCTHLLDEQILENLKDYSVDQLVLIFNTHCE